MSCVDKVMLSLNSHFINVTAGCGDVGLRSMHGSAYVKIVNRLDHSKEINYRAIYPHFRFTIIDSRLIYTWCSIKITFCIWRRSLRDNSVYALDFSSQSDFELFRCCFFFYFLSVSFDDYTVLTELINSLLKSLKMTKLTLISNPAVHVLSEQVN